MKIGNIHLIGYISGNKLKEVILDIEAIKEGNFDLIDNWNHNTRLENL